MNSIAGRASRRLSLLCLVLVVGATGFARAEGPGREGWRDVPWRPRPGVSWQYQLSGRVDTAVKAKVFDIDLFDSHARLVRRLHAREHRVICYLSAGSWERWRSDAGRFPASVKGRGNGWPGERWLDIRKLASLRPIMNDRLDLCAAKGFDGVELDNVDGYGNRTGFPLSREDQLRYNRYLARAGHARGLSVGLKNDLGQIKALRRNFDFAVNEQCFQYHECWRLAPFIKAGKAVFHVEYKLRRSEFCPRAKAMGFSSMRKRLKLGSLRRPCARRRSSSSVFDFGLPAIQRTSSMNSTAGSGTPY